MDDSVHMISDKRKLTGHINELTKNGYIIKAKRFKDEYSRKVQNGIYSLDFEKEYLIYAYVCAMKMSKQEINDLFSNSSEYIFTKYKEWEEHIDILLLSKSIDELEEINHFLINKIREKKTVNNAFIEFRIAIETALIAVSYNILFEYIKSVTENNDLLKNSLLNSLAINIAYLIGVIIIVIIITFFSLKFSFGILKSDEESNCRIHLYEDIQEIVIRKISNKNQLS